MLGDLSPVLPLSQADAIFIEALQAQQMSVEHDKALCLADIRWAMLRICRSLTGNEGYNFMPSEVDRLTRGYIERKKLPD
jgi:hypothetical protein